MVPRVDPLPPLVQAMPEFVPTPQPVTDPNDPDSGDYAERTTLYVSAIGGLTVETLGRPLP